MYRSLYFLLENMLPQLIHATKQMRWSFLIFDENEKFMSDVMIFYLIDLEF